MLVLATDMARHGEILNTFKGKLEDFDFKSVDHLNSVSRAEGLGTTRHRPMVVLSRAVHSLV